MITHSLNNSHVICIALCLREAASLSLKSSSAPVNGSQQAGSTEPKEAAIESLPVLNGRHVAKEN